MVCMEFEWDEKKDNENQQRHKISFYEAQEAFFDENRIVLSDEKHSSGKEKRYFCIGKVNEGIVTVRFTIRNNRIRIIGAGYWREGKKRYEKENNL
jgi:uncharacterized DUF497 family protein